MAVRKSKQEEWVVAGSRDDWLKSCRSALQRAGFTKVSVNQTLYQVEGNYKKFTIWGTISVTLTPAGSDTKFVATSTANVDNIFALFKNPNQTILKSFKDALE
jgi:hypothetical protein